MRYLLCVIVLCIAGCAEHPMTTYILQDAVVKCSHGWISNCGACFEGCEGGVNILLLMLVGLMVYKVFTTHPDDRDWE